LRKVYDKLGVADRLELALYCLNNRVVEGAVKPASPAQPSPSGENASENPAASTPVPETTH